MTYGKGRRAATVIMFLLLATHLLLLPLSWLGSAAGLPWGNYLSDEGIRWYFLHIQDGFYSPFSVGTFSIALLIGSLERAGLTDVLADMVKDGRVSLTDRQTKACLISGGFFVLYMAGILILLLGPHRVLLSVTGHFYPSPYFAGILHIASLGVVITSLIYAVMSFHLRGWMECLSVIYWGIQRYDVWILDAILMSHLYHAICYVWGDTANGDVFCMMM